MALGDEWNLLTDGTASREKCGGEVLEKSGLREEEQVRGSESRVIGGAARN